MKIVKFEDAAAWQEARRLSVAVYRISGSGSFAKDFGLRDQVQRASVSVMTNIAEGLGRDSTKSLLQFLSYAMGSVTEVKSHLYIAKDLGYLSSEQFEECFSLAQSVSRQITGFGKYLRGIERGTTSNASVVSTRSSIDN